jgi:hypothetical protein
MKEFLVAFAFVLTGFVVGYAASSESNENNLIRDCSITGAHIISNDTVIVCRVVKVDQTRAPALPKEKPEITL